MPPTLNPDTLPPRPQGHTKDMALDTGWTAPHPASLFGPLPFPLPRPHVLLLASTRVSVRSHFPPPAAVRCASSPGLHDCVALPLAHRCAPQTQTRSVGVGVGTRPSCGAGVKMFFIVLKETDALGEGNPRLDPFLTPLVRTLFVTEWEWEWGLGGGGGG